MSFTTFPIPTSPLATVMAAIENRYYVTDYGAVGDGSTDDTAAIQAAIDAADGGGTVIFPKPSVYYKCASALDLSLLFNVTLQGPGGRTENKDDAQYCKIVYTGTGSGVFMDIKRSRGLKFEGLDIQYNSSSFTGILVSSNFALVGGVVGFNFTARHCTIGSTGNTIHTAKAGIYLAGMVRAKVVDCGFYWMDYGIFGIAAAVGDTPYSTAVLIDNCWFNEINIGHVANPHQQWTIIDPIWEPLRSTGNACAVICNINGGLADGLTIIGGGYWDVTTGTGAWLQLAGSGITVLGSYVNLGSGATFIKAVTTINGLAVSGGSISGSAGATVVDANGQIITGYDYGNTLKVDGGITLEANMGSVVRISKTFNTVTATQLYGGGLQGSGIAGTGAGTGPTISVIGNQLGGTITVTPGTSPASSANVIAVAWANLWSAIPKAVIVTPGNAAAAALSGNAAVYEDRTQRTTDRFFLKVGSTALTAGTVYEWEFMVIA